MTAEVAILNSSAIAIAADSAVTIGRGKKIYNSALKVFSLSKVAPVGVMVYGNAGLLDVPWETIVKIYRKQLGAKTFLTLDAYAKDFLAFLPGNASLFPRDLQDGWVSNNVAGYYLSIRDELGKAIDALFKDGKQVDDLVTKNTFKSIIDRRHAHLVNTSHAAGADSAWEKTFGDRLREQATRIRIEVFQKLPLDDEMTSRLHDLAVLAHTREIMSDAHTGLVVCGFGEADVYPALVTHLIDGVYEDRLKYRLRADKSVRVLKGADCSIVPFAQEDMVSTFMEGMNPSIDRFIRKWLSELFSQLPSLIPDGDLAGDLEARAAARGKYAQATEQLLSRFLEQLAGHKRKQHIDPILSMVRVLPKDELAAMAEAMVNLTAFKRRMTDELETVGGPIDVAIISKGDGFVWVKRKHYFQPTLNQHFFANYFRELGNDNA
jgi:hypothetical protein